MYFTIGEIKHNRAAQLAVITAGEFGERVLAGEEPHVSFEAALCVLSQRMKTDTALIAAQLINQDPDKKQTALKVGYEGIRQVFGNDEAVMAFFRQVTTPRAEIRFESVGGVRDDIHAARNRSAVLAAKAAVERWRAPEHEGVLPAEREYMDYLKSVRRTLEMALESKQINATVAEGIMIEIEEGSHSDQRPNIKAMIMTMQVDASREHFNETRNLLLKQYSQALTKNSDNGLTLH